MYSLNFDVAAVNDVLNSAREGEIELGKEVLDSLERMSWEEVQVKESVPIERTPSNLGQILSERNGFRGFFRIFPRHFGPSSQVIEELRGYLSQWLHGIGDGPLDDDENFVPSVWPHVARLLPSMACILSCCSSRVSQLVGNSLTSWLLAEYFDMSSPLFEVRLFKGGGCTVRATMEIEFSFSQLSSVDLQCVSEISLDASFQTCTSAVVRLTRILSPSSVKSEFHFHLKKNANDVCSSALFEENDASSESESDCDDESESEEKKAVVVPSEATNTDSGRPQRKKKPKLKKRQKEMRSMSVRDRAISDSDQTEANETADHPQDARLPPSPSESRMSSRSSRFGEDGRWSLSSRSSTLPEKELIEAALGKQGEPFKGPTGGTESSTVPRHPMPDTQKWSSSKRPSAVRPPRPSVTLGGGNGGRSLGHSFMKSEEGKDLEFLTASTANHKASPPPGSSSPLVSSQTTSSNSPPTSLKDLFSSITNQISFREKEKAADPSLSPRKHATRVGGPSAFSASSSTSMTSSSLASSLTTSFNHSLSVSSNSITPSSSSSSSSAAVTSCGFQFLSGETLIEEVPAVHLSVSDDAEGHPETREGMFCITNYRIVWLSHGWKEAIDGPMGVFRTFTCDRYFVHVPYTSLYRFEMKKKKGSAVMVVATNTFGYYHFRFSSPLLRGAVYAKVRELIPSQASQFFAFSYRMSDIIPGVQGWNVFSIEKEYNRFFVSGSDWRISKVNLNFAVCDTYPELLIVPATISDEELILVAQFRSRGRFPVMTWRHRTNTATISRCAQPRVGLKGNRCDEDERLMTLMLQTNRVNASQIYLLDARPRVNAMANTAMGAGVEDKRRYDMVTIKFLGIDNIHAMRKSFACLHDLCHEKSDSGTGVTWLASLESSKWLEYIRLILHSAIRILRLVHFQSTNVLIHCSDGWDRTPQLSSLSVIMLDPYYRTLVGFLRLLELEWLAFGHKFSDRLGHVFGVKESEVSPVFLQFVDCVFQIMVQFPTEFEFNQSLLMCIVFHSHSAQFGTFLYNSPKERKEAQVSANTHSLWTYVLAEKESFLNPLYKLKGKGKESAIIIPKTNVKDLTLWREFYFGDGRHRDAYVLSSQFLRDTLAHIAVLESKASPKKARSGIMRDTNRTRNEKQTIQSLATEVEPRLNRRSVSNPNLLKQFTADMKGLEDALNLYGQ